MRLSARSDSFNSIDKFAGIVLWSKDGQVDWYCNHVYCKAGYVYIKKSVNIPPRGSQFGQVHGDLYLTLFNEEPRGIVGTGFSIENGQFCWNSTSVNTGKTSGGPGA